MRKIEFDYLQGKFVIETDEADDKDFIKEYSEIFFEKLSTCKYEPKTNPTNNLELPKREIVAEEIPLLNNTSEAIPSDVIPLFDITSKQLAYLIDFSNDSIKIIVRNKFIKGTKAEMQVALSLLYCGACEYKGIKANTKDIRNICTAYQCLDGNFAPNIKRENFFNISGGVNADICLTMPGKDKLIDITKEIVSAMELN